MIQELLIEAAKGALVGGLIGYTTNHLAVRMLFHPKRQWRIAGLNVPLTPGLVVKNQEKLADSIGGAVARDLLDSETLLAHLSEIDLAAPIARVLAEERNHLMAAEKPLAELLGTGHEATLQRVRETIVTDLLARADGIALALERGDPDMHRIIRGILGEVVDQPIGELLTPHRRIAIRRWITDQAGRLAAGDKGREGLIGAFDGLLASIARAPVDGPRRIARQLATPAAPHLAEGIQSGFAQYLQSDEFGAIARERLAERLYDMILEKFPFAKMLLREDTVAEILEQRWDDLTQELAELARHETLRQRLIEEIESGAEGLADHLGEEVANEERRRALATQLATESREAVLDWTAGGGLAGIIDDWLARLAQQSLADIVDGNEEWLEELASGGARRVAGWIRSDAGRGWLRQRLESMMDSLIFQRPVGDLIRLVPEREWEALSLVLGGVFHERALRILPAILRDHVNLAEVVSTKIRDFDTERIEETIKRVSGRELKGIVRLGGVIGLGVGAVMQVVYHLWG